MKTIKLELKECSNRAFNGLILDLNKAGDTNYISKNSNIKVVDVYNQILEIQEEYKNTGSMIYLNLNLILQFADKNIFIDEICLVNE
jgi:hypothetical protein